MKDAAELKRHIYDIVGALHSVHDEPGPGINEYCYQEALAMGVAMARPRRDGRKARSS